MPPDDGLDDPFDGAGSVFGPAPGVVSGWHAGDPATLAEPARAAATDIVGGRYTLGGLVGVGGMGHVLAAHDTVLGRDVALKIVHPDRAHDPAVAAHLAHEARVTAELDHPAIVPVHDAGVGADGAPFYVMRLVRGRSLAEEIAARPTLDARLALLRPTLTACEAIAWAHHRGVVHRDLKPANLMLGEFGEVQVMDWGLAARVGAPATGPVGTKPYMSPEQAAAAPAAPAADVYSLGVLLLELLSGRAPDPAAISSGSDLRPSRDPAHGGRGVAERAPPELLAIIRRCLSPDARERYSARELADDLARYLDGRRVAAHDYSPAALLRRLVRAWRVPLVVATVALVVIIALVVAGTARLVAERDRAESSLARAQVGQAETLFAADALPEAEDLARQALRHLNDPADPARARATGMLLTDYAPPSLADVAPLPPACAIPRLAPDRDDLLLCLGDHQARLFRRAGPDAGAVDAPWTLAWSAPSDGLNGRIVPEAEAVVLLGADRRLVRVALASGARVGPSLEAAQVRVAPTRRRIVATDPGAVVVAEAHGAGATRRSDAPCPGGRLQAIALDRAEAHVALACSDDEVRVAPLAPPGSTAAIGDPTRVEASATALALEATDEGLLLVWGDARGALGVATVHNGAATPGWTRMMPAAVVALDLGDQLAVTLEGGRVHVVSRDGDDLATLPGRPATRGLVHLADGGLVTVDDDAVRRWAPPPAWRPHRLLLAPDLGLTGATPSPDGGRVGASLADGRVIVATRGGARLAAIAPWPSLVKPLAWSADGQRLVGAWMAHDGLVEVDLSEAPPRTRVLAATTGRRVAVLAGGLVLTVAFDRASHLQDPRGQRVAVDDLDLTTFADVGHTLAGDWAVLAADASPRLLLLHITAPADGGPPAVSSRRVEIAAPAYAVDVTADGRAALLARPAGVALVDLHTAAERPLAAVDGHPLAVSLTPDDARAAAGLDDGAVAVWDVASGALLAYVRAHRERVVRVEVFAGGAALVSSSWDGAARFWDLNRLGPPP